MPRRVVILKGLKRGTTPVKLTIAGVDKWAHYVSKLQGSFSDSSQLSFARSPFFGGIAKVGRHTLILIPYF